METVQVGPLWSCKLIVTVLACQGCRGQKISSFSHNLVHGGFSIKFISASWTSLDLRIRGPVPLAYTNRCSASLEGR